MATSAKPETTCSTLKENVLVDVLEVVYTQDDFLKNLSQQLFPSGQFSDVTLNVGGKRFPVHKVILAASSTYFQRMFYDESWKECCDNEVKLEETSSCQEVFEMFLGYFYSGSVTVSKKTVIPLITLADTYDVQGLKEVCSLSIAKVLLEKCALETAFQWVIFTEQMSMRFLQQTCYDLICFNFDKACNLSGWLALSLEQVLVILERSDVVTSSEYTVFEAVQNWCFNYSVTEKDLHRILSQVQFKNMTPEQLYKVENSDLASLHVCKEHNVLTPFTNDAFRYIALRDNNVKGNNKPAEFQRYYTSGNVFPAANSSQTSTGSYAKFIPKCRLTSETKKYEWDWKNLASLASIR